MDYWCAITQNSSYGTLSLKNTVFRNQFVGTFEISCAKGKNSNNWSLIFDAKNPDFFQTFKMAQLTLLHSNIDFLYKTFLIFWNILRFFGVVANCKKENIHFWCQETKAWEIMGLFFNCGGWRGCIFIDVIMSYYYIGEKIKHLLWQWNKNQHYNIM